MRSFSIINRYPSIATAGILVHYRYCRREKINANLDRFTMVKPIYSYCLPRDAGCENEFEKTKPTVGFEPTTTGLQNQSSTVELRWHNYSTIYDYIDLKCGIILHLSRDYCKKILLRESEQA
jgi:hypothetical protein